MVKHIKSYEEFKEEIKSGKVFVDFFATWCGPCKMLSPLVDQVSEEYSDIKFIKVDVDLISEAARDFKVMSIPTLITFNDGVSKGRVAGYLEINRLRNFIENNF